MGQRTKRRVQQAQEVGEGLANCVSRLEKHTSKEGPEDLISKSCCFHMPRDRLREGRQKPGSGGRHRYNREVRGENARDWPLESSKVQNPAFRTQMLA